MKLFVEKCVLICTLDVRGLLARQRRGASERVVLVGERPLAQAVNPLMRNSDLQILLCLTPDDFTRQRETPWALKG